MVEGTTLLLLLTGGIIFFGLIGYLVIIYNGLVRLKKDINEAWSKNGHKVTSLPKPSHLIDICLDLQLNLNWKK